MTFVVELDTRILVCSSPRSVGAETPLGSMARSMSPDATRIVWETPDLSVEGIWLILCIELIIVSDWANANLLLVVAELLGFAGADGPPFDVDTAQGRKLLALVMMVKVCDYFLVGQ